MTHLKQRLTSSKAVTETDGKIIALADKEWQYRGEGGANLVISLVKERTVIRFAKSKYPHKDQDSKISEIAHFANRVMGQLLGSNYFRPVQIGVVGEDDFRHIRMAAQPFRPPDRCHKDISSHRVIISPDCVFLTPEYEQNTVGDTFSIEIKPKQGWHSLKASCSVDLCHRCLKQYAKLYQGKIDVISKYCPLDLFSGDKARMKRAIFDLIRDPCNRFKVFKNGNIIYTHNTGSLDEVMDEMSRLFDTTPSRSMDLLSALLCSGLLAEYDEECKWFDIDDEFVSLDPDLVNRSEVCDVTCQEMPPSCVLQKILTLQRHTDISDHGAKKLCDKLLSTIDDIEGLHQLIMWHPHAKLELQLTASEIESIIQLQRFLLSVTAKDISILLTFRRIDTSALEENLPSIPAFRCGNGVASNDFRLMISVIDLDPKPVHRIATWVKRKEEWLAIYSDSIKSVNLTSSSEEVYSRRFLLFSQGTKQEVTTSQNAVFKSTSVARAEARIKTPLVVQRCNCETTLLPILRTLPRS